MSKLLEIFAGGHEYPKQYTYSENGNANDAQQTPVNTRVSSQIRPSSHLKPGSYSETARLTPNSVPCGDLALDQDDLVGMIVVPSFSILDSITLQAEVLAENCGFKLALHNIHAGERKNVRDLGVDYHTRSTVESSGAFFSTNPGSADDDMMRASRSEDGLYIIRPYEGPIYVVNPLVICLRIRADGTNDTEGLLKFDGSNPFNIVMSANYRVEGMYRPLDSCCAGHSEYINPAATPTNGVFINENRMFDQ